MVTQSALTATWLHYLSSTENIEWSWGTRGTTSPSCTNMLSLQRGGERPGKKWAPLFVTYSQENNRNEQALQSKDLVLGRQADPCCMLLGAFLRCYRNLLLNSAFLYSILCFETKSRPETTSHISILVFFLSTLSWVSDVEHRLNQARFQFWLRYATSLTY